MKRKIKILNIVIFILLVLQVFNYASCLIHKEEIEDPAEKAGYYFGANLFLIIAIILFINLRELKKKLIIKEQEDSIDSIGKTEES